MSRSRLHLLRDSPLLLNLFMTAKVVAPGHSSRDHTNRESHHQGNYQYNIHFINLPFYYFTNILIHESVYNIPQLYLFHIYQNTY